MIEVSDITFGQLAGLAALMVTVIIVRARLPDPDLIDYDAPGVDITSEGPEGRTRAWYEIEGDDSHDMG